MHDVGLSYLIDGDERPSRIELKAEKKMAGRPRAGLIWRVPTFRIDCGQRRLPEGWPAAVFFALPMAGWRPRFF
jgi:hypothetical protein